MAAVRSPEPARRGVVRRLVGARAADGPPPQWRTRVTAGLAGAALAVSALGVLVALSADAQPGDLLYDLKRGTERTQLALAGDDRALTLLQFASTRLDEVGAEQDDADLVVQTLAMMDAQTTEGAALLVGSALGSGTSAEVDRLADWSEDQAAELTRLRPRLSGGTAGAARASLGLLDAVQARVIAVRAALDCAPPPPAQGRDDLGPIPGSCDAATTAVPSDPGGAPPVDRGTATGGPPASTTAPAPTAAPLPTPASQSSAVPRPHAVPQPGGGSGSPSTGAGPALPSIPLPIPGAGGGQPLPLPPSAATPAGTASPPPLVDVPLPICIPRLVC
jgi:hypothetical protein